MVEAFKYHNVSPSSEYPDMRMSTVRTPFTSLSIPKPKDLGYEWTQKERERASKAVWPSSLEDLYSCVSGFFSSLIDLAELLNLYYSFRSTMMLVDSEIQLGISEWIALLSSKCASISSYNNY